MTKALIIGGGHAGPVAAMALQKAGIEATVLEAYGAPADHTGLFLNTASNGLDALKAIDLDLAARADGHPMPRLVFWSGAGRRLGKVANGVRLDDGTVSVGQGASIACEDAIVLAKCLRDLPDPATAFAAYERLRRERVEKVVAYARKRSNSKTAGPVGRVVRDLMMPVVLKLFASEKAHGWACRYHIDWDEKVA